MPIIHSFINIIVIEMMNTIREIMEIFDRLFMKINGVINEISKSKIKNRIVIIKKLMENGIFNIVFSLNPHSKFILIELCFFKMFKFTKKVMIMKKLFIIKIVITINIKFINFFSF